MAKRTKVLFVDDLDGTELPEGSGQTVSFSLDGVSYEVDLSKKNADALRKDLKRYVDVARKVGRQQARRTSRRQDSSAIRAWAKQHGHEVSERGRIPASVVEAYQAAN
jgi:hypothetical protein